MLLIDVITKAQEVLQKIPNSEADCARLEEYRSQLSQDIVTIAVVGEFSSGKSSLINALIGNQLLPVADRPLTSKRVEIRHSEKAMLSLHWSKPASAVTRRSLLEVFAALETRGTSLSVLSLKKRVFWTPESTVCNYIADNPETIASFLWVIENSRQQKKNTVPPGEKKNRSQRQFLLTKFLHDTALMGIRGIVKVLPNPCPNMIRALLIKAIQRIWCDSSAKERAFCQTDDIEKVAIGLPLPQSWENICLIDLPGAGSLHSYHLNTKTALETTQIVLHVLDVEHIGSKLTEELMRDSSSSKMTIYVLNKQDSTNPDDLKKCIAFLKKQYDITPQAVSALYEDLALQLHNGSISVEEVCNHSKVKLAPLICSREWNGENLESNKEAIVSYLHNRSGIEILRDTLTKRLRDSHPSLDAALAPAIVTILKKNLIAVQTCLKKVEHSPETEQLQEKIDRLRERSNNIETFLNDANEKYHEAFKNEIRRAFKALHSEFRTTLSRALHTEFSKCERNFTSTAFRNSTRSRWSTARPRDAATSSRSPRPALPSPRGSWSSSTSRTRRRGRGIFSDATRPTPRRSTRE